MGSRWTFGTNYWRSRTDDARVMNLHAAINQLPPEVQCFLWAVLLCVAGALVVWVRRRWRMHQRGLLTAAAMGVLACSLLGALAVVADRASLLTWGAAGSSGTGLLLGPMDLSAEEPFVATLEESYHHALVAREASAVGVALASARSTLTNLPPRIVLARRRDGLKDCVVLFPMEERPVWPANACHAFCVVQRIAGQSVKGPGGRLAQADLARTGPATVEWWGDAANAVNMSSNTLIDGVAGSLHVGQPVSIDWALVLVGPDDESYQILSFRHDALVEEAIQEFRHAGEVSE